MTNRSTATLGTCLALALAVTGCSSDGDDADNGHDDDGGLSKEHSVLGALAEIPESVVDEDSVLVQTADLRAASEADGLDVPTGGSRDDVANWLLGLTNDPQRKVFVPVAESFNSLAASPDEFAEVAGWSLIDVDSFVEYAVPPSTFAVAQGDFDDDTLDSDLIDVGDGVVTDREGDDNEVDPGEPSALNQLGQPTRFAQQGDRIALSRSTPAVESWLEGEGTLADDDSFSSVATALDDEDVVSAVLASVAGGSDPSAALLGEGASPEQLKALQEEFDNWLPEKSFDAVGIGWGVDDGEGRVYAAYHFDSSSAAEEGATALEKNYREGSSLQTRTPWNERMDVDDVEVDGSVVTVAVSPTAKGAVMDLQRALLSRDALFISR
ncbi:hypothetical protein ASG90_00295 [Nocardioides sp. Soil797]|nr:hypothetical protein ASG90_00295 [Nocardioides sp. Soil797]